MSHAYQTAFCRQCGHRIHAAAPACPVCGSHQAAAQPGGSQGFAIASMVLGIVCMLVVFDDADWDADTAIGMMLFAAAGIGLGAFNLHRKGQGRGMAVSGLVMCGLGVLFLVSDILSGF